MKTRQGNLRRIIDIGMTVLLLLQMAYQVMGEAAHEWLGMSMTVMVIVHQVLNRRWYRAMLKGKYTAYRAVSTCVNVLLLLSFALTAFCGMAMSNYAVPFLYGIVRVSFVRVTHLSMSHWSFVLMGLHLGLHMPVMLQKLKLKDNGRRVLSAFCAGVAGAGLWLFFKNGMPNYLFFRVPFAFLDYEKAGALVLLENVVMLLFWAFAGFQLALMLRKKGHPLLSVTLILSAVVVGVILNMIWPNQNDFGMDSGWGDAMETPWQSAEPELTVEFAPLGDEFILVDGGTFKMGSPEDENWRIDDETQHEVTVASFYIDPYGMSAQLKTVVDRFCAYNSSLNSRHLKSALLTVAWNADDWTFYALTAHYKTIVRYIRFSDMGMVLGYGCGTPSMTRGSDYPQEAYRLGRGL